MVPTVVGWSVWLVGGFYHVTHMSYFSKMLVVERTGMFFSAKHFISFLGAFYLPSSVC